MTEALSYLDDYRKGEKIDGVIFDMSPREKAVEIYYLEDGKYWNG